MAAALEELESLQSECLSLQQDIDRAVDQMHSPPDEFEEEKSSAHVGAESKGQNLFEQELRKLERQMTMTEPEFEHQVTKMEQVVTEQGGMLCDVVENMSERPARPHQPRHCLLLLQRGDPQAARGGH